jgi:hypothetical protein
LPGARLRAEKHTPRLNTKLATLPKVPGSLTFVEKNPRRRGRAETGSDAMAMKTGRTHRPHMAKGHSINPLAELLPGIGPPSLPNSLPDRQTVAREFLDDLPSKNVLRCR